MKKLMVFLAMVAMVGFANFALADSIYVTQYSGTGAPAVQERSLVDGSLIRTLQAPPASPQYLALSPLNGYLYCGSDSGNSITAYDLVAWRRRK